MALMPSKQEADELARREKEEAEREARKKEKFIEAWVEACKSNPYQQAHVLWERFAKKDHDHPPSIGDIRFFG